MAPRVFRTITAALIVLTILPLALAADPSNRRLIVRNGELFRSTTPVHLRAIETPALFRPGVTDEHVVKSFINISKVGATGVWFELGGLSADGRAIDRDHVDTLRTVKAESIYRYIAPVCRVLGSMSDAGHDARMNAIRTVAQEFADDFAMIYWIDGPDSATLTAEFKKLAPKLTVLSPSGGDIDLVDNPGKASDGRPAVIVGALPTADSGIHSLMPDGEATYAAFEAVVMERLNPAACTPSTVGLSDAEKAEGFVSLFDGTSLDCWIITGRNPDGWAVRDGVIEWVERNGGVILSRKQYGDFILRLEWRLFRENGNSGLFLRAPIQNRMSKMGFEFQMMGDHGKEPDRHITGSIYSVLEPLSNAGKPVGEWNELEIHLNGPHYKAILNGEVVQDVNFDDIPEMKHRLRHGHLGLQDHNDKVMFRNIRIKEL